MLRAVELALGVPAGSPKSVESQVDLAFAILTEKRDATTGEPAAGDEPSRASEPVAASAPPSSETVVYAWKEREDGSPEGARLKQLEIENLHLKQLVGNLSLEKKLLHYKARPRDLLVYLPPLPAGERRR